MSLKIDVGGAGNAYARQVMNECHGLQGGSNAPHVAEQPVQGAAEDRRPADGVLMRALRQIRRESGPMHAAYLTDVVVAKDVNLNLDHFDEVDGGVSTRAMDEGWVDVDFASDIGKPEGGSRDDAFAVRAQQTMAALACCRAKSGRIGRLVVRSESAESWAWCVARENLFRVGDTFDELVDLLAADDDGIDPLLADYA